jgi:sporulation integral membrane protein YtvI
MFNKEKISFLADVCIIIAFFALLAWLTVGKAFAVLLPFVIAFLIATLIQRPVSYIARRTRIPAFGISTVLVLGTVTLLCVGIWNGANRLIIELGRLIVSLGEGEDGIGGNVAGLIGSIDSITSRFPVLREGGEEFERVWIAVDEFVKDSVNKLAQSLAENIAGFIGGTVKRLPEVFLYIIVTVIASVYMSSHYVGVKNALLRIIPASVRTRLLSVGDGALHAVKQYIRAYSLLFIITFGEIFFGLALMRVRYAFFLALLISIVDILPIFGVGTVLLPWATVELLLGNSRTFTSLLILYAVVTVVRQITEPKIVGSSLGINPLLTLFFMFSGYNLFGVLGMILFPTAAVILSGSVKEQKKTVQKDQTT